MLVNTEHEQIIAQNDYAILVCDGYPVSDGHCLVISKRHVGSFFEITSSEREAMFELLDKAKVISDALYHPDSYNLGINDGPAAGQTVPHVHIHIIPRYIGDAIDPRGGVRWVKPDKAVYWEKI
jgi:diadenosine tetraphosphate (Ap4A) HIT family hydrolase